jgi:2-dehydro-3-deoxyphosphogluconate aldolase/(4S)-4-hydroxy-2-oxoglutarate aldolase
VNGGRMSKQSTIQRLLTPGIIAILRSPTGAKLIDAAKAALAGGVTAMEVTMTTPGALNIIRDTKRALGDQIVMGVGSVLDAESCRSALLAGAEFVVTPVVRPDVIQLANRYGVPIISGAFTPTEALSAQELGSDFIKLFPADSLGPGYIRSLLQPMPSLQIIPTGGVTPENTAAYLDAGAVAIGVGGGLVSQELLDNGDWPKLTKIAGKFIAAVKKKAKAA